MTSGLQGFRPTPQTERALRLRQAADKTYATIRADPNLSDIGKQKAMAAAWLKSNATLAEIQDAENDDIAARRSALEIQLFGIGPGGPVAAADYRDALDRAEQCTKPKDAFRLLDRVTRTRDETLAKAVAAYAVEQGWSDVLDRYAATRPNVQDTLAELRKIDADASSGTARLGRSAIYNTPKPRELQHLTTPMIQTLATQSGDDLDTTAGVATAARSAFNTRMGRS